MKKKVLFAVGLVLAILSTQAQALDLSLDKAVELALKNSLSLKAQDFQLNSKKRSKDFAWNAFLPKTSVGAALSRMNQAPENPLAAFGFGGNPPHTWLASASLSAQLNITVALFDGIHHTVLDYESGLIGRELATQMLVRDVKKAFFNLILIRESRITFEGQIETARKRFEKERRSFESGTGSEFSMLSAQVGLENMKPALDDLANGYRTAELAFKQLLGIEAKTPLAIQGSMDYLTHGMDVEKLVEDSMGANLSLLSLRKAIEIQKNARRGRLNQAWTPVLSLIYTADPYFTKDPFKDALWSDPTGEWKQSTGMFSVALSLPLDGFLPFSGTGVDLSNQEDQISETETNLLAAVQGTQVKVTSLYLSVDKSRQAVERLELNSELAERAYRMAEKGYETGAFERLEVEDAANKLREARLKVLAEKYAHLSAIFDLEFETGRTLSAPK